MELANDSDFQSGLEFSLRGEFSDAIVSFEIALTRHPAEAAAYYEIGMAYQQRAESSVPTSLKLKDSSDNSVNSGVATSVGGVVNALMGLAVVGAAKAIGQTDWILRYRDDFRSSVKYFELALAIDPTNAPALHALAHSLRYLGQREAAATRAQEASSLDPGNRSYDDRSKTIEAIVSQSTVSPVVNTWDDIVLSDKTKRELRQMQLLLEKPALSRDLGIEPPSGLLLYGPPGTGKTTIARVLAHESKCRFFATTPAEVNSMWLGESEKQVARLFAMARANAPSIVFLDEIDALLPSRSGGINMYSDKVVNQFLHEMDGLNRNVRVFVVGATNRRDMLDPALLRGGRLSREIEVPLPNEPARTALLLLYTKNTRLDQSVVFDDLVKRTEGFSGANIKALVNEAGLQALIRLSDGPDNESGPRHLIQSDFDEALINYKLPTQDPPTSSWRMFG